MVDDITINYPSPVPPAPADTYAPARATGTVDPEGAIPAPAGTIYLNKTTEKVFMKKNGSGKTGWIEIIG